MSEESGIEEKIAAGAGNKIFADVSQGAIELVEAPSAQTHLPVVVNEPEESATDVTEEVAATGGAPTNFEQDRIDPPVVGPKPPFNSAQQSSSASDGGARRLALILLGACFAVVICFGALLPKLFNGVNVPALMGVADILLGRPSSVALSNGARSYAAADKFDDALKDISVAVDDERLSGRLAWLNADLMWRASLYREMGRYSEGRKDTEEILSHLTPDHWSRWHRHYALQEQAKLLILSGQPRQAISTLEKGLENEPSLQSFLPQYLVFAGEPAEAVKKYKEMTTELTPAQEIQMAFALSRAGNSAAARKILEHSKGDISETMIESPFGAAPVLEELGTGELLMQSLYPADQWFIGSYFQLKSRVDRALAYELSGNYRKAEKLASLIIEADPSRSIAYRIRAGARIAQGKFSDALADLNQAIKLNPFYGKAFYERSMLNKQLGKLEDAKGDAAAAARFGWAENRDQTEKLERR